MAEPIRIMVVDDHYLVRVGLTSIVTVDGDMTVCAEAATGEQAIAIFRAQQPDVTLMDLRLPGMSGADATLAILGEFPGARIVVLSTYAADEEIYVALQAGAMGYLLKTVQPDELLMTIRKVAAGERHLSSDISARLASRSPRSHLSPRELAVLRLVVDGKRNKEIASALDISEGTVKIHVSNILVKLAVSDRTEAVTAALRRGIIPLPS